MTVQNTTSQIYINSTRGYTPKYRKHVYILIGQFQAGFFYASFMDLITYIHRNRYTIKKTPNLAIMQFFIFMSKVNLGTLPSTQNTFSVLLDSVCAVTALITNCDKSQIATAGIPELSQFVTVQNTTSQIDFIVTEGILLSAENMFTSKSDPFKKVSWVHRL